MSLKCEPETIFCAKDVSEFHGLHALLRSREDAFKILDIVNSIRGLARNSDPVTPCMLINSIASCYQCQQFSGIPTGTSPTGIYYAPPGNGKSTAQRKELFIGIDTDWLIKESDFPTIMLPFLKIGIPIVTNQYHLCLNSGEKFIGIFNPSKLRCDPNGNPFTPLAEIVSALNVMKDDLHVIFTTKYMDEMMLTLFRVNSLYQHSRSLFLDRIQSTVKKKVSHLPFNQGTDDLILRLKHRVTQSSGTRWRTRKRAKQALCP